MDSTADNGGAFVADFIHLETRVAVLLPVQNPQGHIGPGQLLRRSLKSASITILFYLWICSMRDIRGKRFATVAFLGDCFPCSVHYR